MRTSMLMWNACNCLICLRKAGAATAILPGEGHCTSATACALLHMYASVSSEPFDIRHCHSLAGYFDVRDENDQWIRIALNKGDMITLPEGIYHRFTLDDVNYVKVSFQHACFHCCNPALWPALQYCLLHIKAAWQHVSANMTIDSSLTSYSVLQCSFWVIALE